MMRSKGANTMKFITVETISSDGKPEGKRYINLDSISLINLYPSKNTKIDEYYEICMNCRFPAVIYVKKEELQRILDRIHNNTTIGLR